MFGIWRPFFPGFLCIFPLIEILSRGAIVKDKLLLNEYIFKFFAKLVVDFAKDDYEVGILSFHSKSKNSGMYESVGEYITLHRHKKEDRLSRRSVQSSKRLLLQRRTLLFGNTYECNQWISANPFSKRTSMKEFKDSDCLYSHKSNSQGS